MRGRSSEGGGGRDRGASGSRAQQRGCPARARTRRSGAGRRKRPKPAGPAARSSTQQRHSLANHRDGDVAVLARIPDGGHACSGGKAVGAEAQVWVRE